MKIFFDRLQMIQFAKLAGLNLYLSTFRKFPLQQGVHIPVLKKFREKYENITIKNLADIRLYYDERLIYLMFLLLSREVRQVWWVLHL